uniref:uncharacterized protein LOC125906478 n=1 Tax=Anopheles coluzzii TaxID=1518534 RepID=UPI0020FF903D|nr:uncharacterized protein LOC125906478 [Anopheles coluzzii]
MTVISSLKQPPEEVSITVGGVNVPFSRSIKYLGVRVQDHLSWVPHVKEITLKATRIVHAVNRLMPNLHGPRTSKSRLLTNVADSTMRYAAPVWTKRLAIKSAADYFVGCNSRKHGDVTFHLSQVLSGHGFFREHLCGMQLTSSPDCTRCPGVAESAEHAMFECPRFDSTRTELLHGVVPETLLEHMLQSPENWSNVCEATKRITSALQQDWDETR